MESSGLHFALLIAVNVAIWIVLFLISRLKHKDKIFLVLAFISFWVFLAIRVPYSDANTYANYFEALRPGDFDGALENRWEPLFKVLLYGIRLITDDARVMLAIVSLVTLVGPFLFLKKYSKNYLLSVVMFIAIGSFYTEFFVLRQAVAISVFLAAFHLISEKKLVKYCIAVAVAAMFHKTALVLLLVYPIVNIPPSKYKNIFMVAAAVLAIVFGSQVSEFLISDIYDYAADRVVFGGGINLLVFYIVLYGLYYLLDRKLHVNERKEIMDSTLFTIFIQFLTTQSNLFSRITTYTRDAFCVLIPNVIEKLDFKNRMLLSAVVIAVCVGFVMVSGDFSGYDVYME